MQDHQSYKIKYPKCLSAGNHQGENLNLICLEPQCKNALICSFCKVQSHHNHPTKTVKHCLESILNNIKQQNSKINIKILHQKKEEFLNALARSVEELSSQFKTLEQKVLLVFKNLQKQLTQKSQNQTQFENFYSEIIKGRQLDGNNLITKLLNHRPQYFIPSVHELNSAMNIIQMRMRETIKILTKSQHQQSTSFTVFNKQNVYPIDILLPKGMTYVSQTLTHTKQCSENLVLLSNGTTPQMIKVQINVIQKPQKLYVGVMTLPYYKNHSFVFDPRKDKDVAWICSNSKSSNYLNNNITKFDQGQTIFLTLRKDQLVVKKKKDKQFATLKSQFTEKQNRYFFVAMEGSGKLEIGECKYSDKN